jgi:hypothetical protein
LTYADELRLPALLKQLGGDVCATLTAAGGKNGTAGTGAHAKAKTMSFGTTTIIWLKGTL